MSVIRIYDGERGHTIVSPLAICGLGRLKLAE